MHELQHDEQSNSPARKEYYVLAESSGSGPLPAHLLKSSLGELLREYKKFLAPGAYYLMGRFEDDTLKDIEEIHVPFAGDPSKEEHVTFAFFEKGYPPEDAVRQGFHRWKEHYPFSHAVSSTSQEFQDVLTSYIRTQLSHLYD